MLDDVSRITGKINNGNVEEIIPFGKKSYCCDDNFQKSYVSAAILNIHPFAGMQLYFLDS